MACNCRRCNDWRNEEVREEREERVRGEVREESVRGVRNCRPLVNDINRLIKDIREDAGALDRKFDELEDRGCIRGVNSWDDDWDWGCHWDCWNWCNRHCNNRRG